MFACFEVMGYVDVCRDDENKLVRVSDNNVTDNTYQPLILLISSSIQKKKIPIIGFYQNV